MSEEITTRLAAIDFSHDIKRLSEDFKGREWLFDEIDGWLKDDKKRFFILTGEPGVGKSAIAARLTQVRPDNILAYHFCIAGNIGTIVPNTVLRSLAAQLGDTLPKYGEALANTIKPSQISINIHQVIGKVEAGAKVVGAVISHLTASNSDEELDILLRAPLSALKAPDRPQSPVFILIDSLDEAKTYQGESNLITLLAKANDLPGWVRFVCTTRPEQAVLSYFQRFEPYMLAAESQMNQDDIKQYVNYRVDKKAVRERLAVTDVTPEVLAEHVGALANGNFLYTKMLLNDIETGQQSLDDLTALPKSLDDIYFGFLRRFSDEDWDTRYQPVLGKLAVAQEPITETQLANFTGIHQRQVKRNLTVIDQYLDVLEDAEGSKTYRLFHQSLRDYLLDKARSDLFWCDAQEEHACIADHYFDLYQDKWSDCALYGLRYLPVHIAGAGQTEGLQDLLLNFDWMWAKLRATDINVLIADYGFALSEKSSLHQDHTLGLVHEALRLSSHVLSHDKTQLSGQLLGRLGTFDAQPIQYLLFQARIIQTSPWLYPMFPTLTPPGGPLLRTLTGHTRTINAVTLTLDGRRVVSGSDDGTLKVWDVESGIELYTLIGHSNKVKAVAMTPDGRRVVSGSTDQTLKVWDIVSGTELTTLRGHTDEVAAVAVTADGRCAVSGSDDRTLKVWDLESGAELRTLTGHSLWVTAVAMTPDGRLAISGSGDNTLKVWDVERGVEIRTPMVHEFTVLAIAMTPDGRLAVSSSDLNTLKVWDVETGTELYTLPGHGDRYQVSAVAVTSDGQRMISASVDRNLKVWDLESGTELFTLIGHSNSLTAVAMTPDGRRAVSASVDGTLKVWDIAHEGGGEEIVPTVSLSETEYRLMAHPYGIQTVAMTPDGRREVSTSENQTLKVRDIETNKELCTLIGHTGDVCAVEVTPDGQQVVSASGFGDRTLKVWNMKTGSILCTLTGHKDDISAVAVTPDGRLMISASCDKTLKVWDMETSKEVRTLAGHSMRVNAVAVTPDGQLVISASDDRTLKVWDIESGIEVSTLTEHTGPVNAVAVTPDRQWVISASDDRTLRVWHLESAKLIATFSGDGIFTRCGVVPDDTPSISGITIVVCESFNAERFRVHAIRLENVVPGPPIVTAWHSRMSNKAFLHQNDILAFGCPFCLTWSEIPESALGTELPCPQCSGTVKLNPFVLDADWRAVEKAWLRIRR